MACAYEVGGGVRDAGAIQRLLDLGAARVLVGTRALEEPSWLEEVAFKFPGKLMLAADARGRQVVTCGWTRTLTQDVGGAHRRRRSAALAGSSWSPRCTSREWRAGPTSS